MRSGADSKIKYVNASAVICSANGEIEREYWAQNKLAGVGVRAGARAGNARPMKRIDLLLIACLAACAGLPIMKRRRAEARLEEVARARIMSMLRGE